MTAREPSRTDLVVGLAMLGLVAAYAYGYVTGTHRPTGGERWLVVAWAAIGSVYVLTAVSERFRRWWGDPRVQAVLGVAALAVAAVLYAAGDHWPASIALLVGVLFGAGAIYESHRRGTLRTNRSLPVVAGVVGLGFVGFGVFVRTRYPRTAAMALTSFVVGLVLLAWGMRELVG